jgi:polysaccharide deacetylase family protein (PEP-CTERM system associated)
MINALTIDVEDYYHVTAFDRSVSIDSWDSYPSRVVNNTLRILDLLDEHSIKATFFILGWVAERQPKLVKAINDRGHEIACHGHGHQLIYRIGPDAFRSDVRRAKKVLEDMCGRPVLGYRAPSYSITKASLWAFDILIEEGFRYDSSIFPIAHDIYGIPQAKRFPHDITRAGGSIREFPMSTLQLRLLGKDISVPVAGGGYLRVFPLWFIKHAIRSINEQEKQPAVIYFHPWEIDCGQPRIKAGLRSTFRHYINIRKTFGRVKQLLTFCRFSPMMDVLGMD